MAQYGLGAYLANGVGIEKDLFQAAYWLSLAAMQGQKHALESRDSVLKMLSSTELDNLNEQMRMVDNSKPLPARLPETDEQP
ncbi:MAG: SEL1-like repeat protein [Thiolinea sp.]